MEGCTRPVLSLASTSGDGEMEASALTGEGGLDPDFMSWIRCSAPSAGAIIIDPIYLIFFITTKWDLHFSLELSFSPAVLLKFLASHTENDFDIFFCIRSRCTNLLFQHDPLQN
jgi:hypothetical protein